MGLSKTFEPVKLFCGIIYKEHSHFNTACRELEKWENPIDIISHAFEFTQTQYYCNEMGEPLFRRFVSFRDLTPPEILVEVKERTNRIESEFSREGKRVVNLDPGFVSAANVIIATTKNHYHRVPLNRGIYAHMEYVFKKKAICSLEWTYPDFKNKLYLSFFQELYDRYKKEIASLKGGNQ